MAQEPTSAIWQWSATDIVAAVGARQITVTEIVQTFLDRIDHTNPAINAVVTDTRSRALAEAAVADQRLRDGYPVRPLEGVPFTVKDTVATKGVRTTFGSTIFRDFVPEVDAVVVERLRCQGAILVGKSNVSEFGNDPYCNTQNKMFGVTRNPWDINRTPGGSSGGAAAAVAAGMAPLAVGTDWGGSIRGPASFCGTVGMRPSPGRIPVYPYETLSGFAWDFPIEAMPAPMAGSVADLGLMFDIMTGPDDRAPASIPREPVDFAAAAAGGTSLAGRRVAYSTDLDGAAPVDPEVAELVRGSAAVLAELGCVVEAAAPDCSQLKATVAATRAFGIALRYAEHLAQHPDQLSPSLTTRVTAALDTGLAEVARGERMRTRLWEQVGPFLRRYDYFLTPTWGNVPFRLDIPFEPVIGGQRQDSYWDCINFTHLASLLGLPAVTVPCGFTSEGVPVGIQLIGRRYGEAALLEAAAGYERRRGSLRRPADVEEQISNPIDEGFLAGGKA